MMYSGRDRMITGKVIVVCAIIDRNVTRIAVIVVVMVVIVYCCVVVVVDCGSGCGGCGVVIRWIIHGPLPRRTITKNLNIRPSIQVIPHPFRMCSHRKSIMSNYSIITLLFHQLANDINFKKVL